MSRVIFLGLQNLCRRGPAEGLLHAGKFTGKHDTIVPTNGSEWTGCFTQKPLGVVGRIVGALSLRTAKSAV